MKYLWLSRFFAAALIIGGVGGAVVSVLTAHDIFLENGAGLFAEAALVALSFFTAAVGVALWRNKSYGKICAAILFALQVPVFSSPSFTYEWFTGMAIKFIGSNGSYAWSAELGGSNNFHLQSGVAEITYGCNVFAMVALLFLLIAHAKKS